MKHLCHASDCKVPVPPQMLMCRDHWRMVPNHIRNEIWAHYRRGQEKTKDPSLQYLAAATAAISYVRDAEEGR